MPVIVFLCLIAAASPAGAAPSHAGSGVSGYALFEDSPTGGLGIYWKAFSRRRAQSRPERAASAAARSDPAEGPRDVLLALTLLPPADSYLYGPESTEGPPTSVHVRIRPASDARAGRHDKLDERAPDARADVPSSAAAQARPGADSPAGLRSAAGEEQAPAVYSPPATPKKATRFASLRFPGLPDDDPLVYAGPATFRTLFPAPEGSDSVSLLVSVSGLLCSESNCRPVAVALDLALFARDTAMLPQAEDEARPVAFGADAGIPVLPPPGAVPKTVPLSSIRIPGMSSAASDPAFAGGVDLETFGASAACDAAEPENAERGDRFAFLQPVPFRTEIEITSLGEAVFFGLPAGLILNLMPCVLPVISLKFSALAAVSSMAGKRARRRAFREHCLLFAAGILTWFCIAALLLGGAGRLWGDLFQQPLVPAVLGLVLFLLALSLFGVFSLPVFDFRIGREGAPRRQAFVGGLLATLLATPCSGPLLGAVLAWAVDRPLFLLVPAVFSVGVGMALPYLLMALNPGLVHMLPKPGPWTLRLEQLLGFFLMGSVVYISTLLPEHWVAPFLYNLLAVAAAAWLWGSIGHLRAGRARRIAAGVCACALLLLSAAWGLHATAPDRTWETFDAERFLADLGKDPMLLDFTADWCPSCKALEYATLSPGRMEDLRKRYNVRTVKVDLTRDAEAGAALLKALRSSSIPLIALFPAGEKAARPVILRDLVTPGQLREAARAVFVE
jgi:thiol:disulfide interchange protein DsbD